MNSYCKICNKKVDEKRLKKSESESADDRQDVIKIKIYCLKCIKHTSSENLKKIDVGGKTQLKADCIECNAREYRFVSKED